MSGMNGQYMVKISLETLTWSNISINNPSNSGKKEQTDSNLALKVKFAILRRLLIDNSISR